MSSIVTEQTLMPYDFIIQIRGQIPSHFGSVSHSISCITNHFIMMRTYTWIPSCLKMTN